MIYAVILHAREQVHHVLKTDTSRPVYLICNQQNTSFYVLRKRRNFMTLYLNSSCQVLTKSARVPLTTIVYAPIFILGFYFSATFTCCLRKKKIDDAIFNSQNAPKIDTYLYNYSTDIIRAKTNEKRHRSFN